MATPAGSLEIIMFSGIARLQADMKAHKKTVSGAMKNIEDSVSQAKGVLASLGIGFSAHMLLAKIDSVTDGMAKLQDASEKTGASVESLSKLQFFAGVSGSSLEGVTGALVKLSKGMAAVGNEGAPTSQALKFLGLSAKDAQGNLKDPSALFGEISQQLFKYQDGAGKAAIAQALFGKAGADMLPTLKKMAELGEIEASVTKEQSEQAERYQIEVAKLNREKEILWNMVVSALLPSMGSFVKVMTAAAKETGSVGSTAKELAADGSIEKWADKGAMAVAVLIDAVKVLPKILSAVAGSFQVVIADAMLLSKAAILINPIASLAEVAKGNNPLADFKTALIARNMALEDANAKYADLLNGEVDATQKAMAAMIAARKAAGPEATRPGGTKALNFALGDAKLAAAELKLYQSALQALEQELAKLVGTTQAQKTQYQLTEGSLKTLTATHAKYLLEVAAKVDKAQEARFVLDYTTALAKQVDEQERQVTLVGKTAYEQELLNVQNKNAVELKQKLYDEERRIGPLSLALIKQMTDATEEANAKQIDAINARREAERSWATGSKSAFDEYIDHATNAAEQAKNLFTHAFSSMEDALVKFAMTGKLDFKSLADSIISDLIRIQIRQAMASAMGGSSGGGFGSFIGSLFGGGGETPVLLNSYASGTDYVPRTGPYMLHQGERVTSAAENQAGGVINVYPDLRGASVETVDALFKHVRALDASVEPRAVAATNNARARGR